MIQRARESDQGMEEWCRSYSGPVRAYLRTYLSAKGHGADIAEEWAQEFFHRLLAKGGQAGLPGQLQGAFRAYLMRSLANFATDRWRSENRQRRGGGATHVELNEHVADDGVTAPDHAFARAWVLALMEKATAIMEKEMEAAGKLDFFHAVSGTLDGADRSGDRSELAARFGLNDGAFRVAVHRLRQRFRRIIEDEVRQTVASAEEFEEEIRYLLSVWS
jgi:RNA polymerase sigma-70 factor (ECF subfamily)